MVGLAVRGVDVSVVGEWPFGSNFNVVDLAPGEWVAGSGSGEATLHQWKEKTLLQGDGLDRVTNDLLHDLCSEYRRPRRDG